MTQDEQLQRVLGLVLELARGNLDARLDPLSDQSPIDGVIEGLNMLAEELSASTEALRRSEQTFRTLIEQAPDAILVHHAGRFRYVNPAALSMLGYSAPEQLVGHPTAPVLQLDPEHAARRWRALGHGAPPHTTREGRMVHLSGRELEVEAVSIDVSFDGEPATLVIAREISARKLLTAKMMEMDRMIAVGTLAAGVGHEINNPLAYVLSNLEFVLEHLDSDEGRDPACFLATRKLIRDALCDAREGARRVRDIVRELKSFSRAGEEQTQRAALRPLLESAINMAFNEIRHRATLVRDYREVPPVSGNASKLSQVFLNLLVNAAQAIPEGDADAHRIEVATGTTADGAAWVEVRDTGGGIDPADKPRLFDPFFTTKPVGEGTGLGLFICRRIVSQHGGELQLDSTPGQGTTARVVLPAAQPHEPRHAAPAPDAAARGTGRARVLVVDDEEKVARTVRRFLSRQHDVTVRTDARQALHELLGGARYDVILCDLMMPAMTGMELHSQLNRRAPELAARMLFFTGGAFTPRTRRFAEEMGDRILEKPLDIQEVRRAVAAAVPRSPRDDRPLAVGD